jgi:hypothetical protein
VEFLKLKNYSSFSNTMVFMVFKTQMFHKTTDFFLKQTKKMHPNRTLDATNFMVLKTIALLKL